MRKLFIYEIKGVVIVCALILSGCAAISAKPGANLVTVVTEESNLDHCEFLGEVAGSQGNWITGGYTSDKNLMIGARNDLKNATYELGGDTVYIQHMNTSGRYEASGLSNTTVIGKAYDCRKK